MGQVPYGTTTCTYRMGLSTDARLDRTTKNIVDHKFPRNPTDNLSFDPPANARSFQQVYDKMATQNAYEKNSLSTNPWQPKPVIGKSVNNRGSQKHDIITHGANTYAGVIDVGVFDKKTNNRKKGITEIRDLARLTSVNTNVDHLKAYQENNNVFKRKDGANTHLYNAAARFGQDKPFDK